MHDDSELESFGPPGRELRLRRGDLRPLIDVGRRRVDHAVRQGMLEWLPDTTSKRYAMFVAFAGLGQPVTDKQCRDLAGVVHGILHGRGNGDWDELKHEGRALSIKWAATSSINSNPNRGFVREEGDRYVCPMW